MTCIASKLLWNGEFQMALMPLPRILVRMAQNSKMKRRELKSDFRFRKSKCLSFWMIHIPPAPAEDCFLFRGCDHVIVGFVVVSNLRQWMIFVAAFRRTPQHTEYFAQSVLIFDQASLCCVRKKQEPEKERRKKKKDWKVSRLDCRIVVPMIAWAGTPHTTQSLVDFC